MMSDYLIPLMVVSPIVFGILLNFLHGGRVRFAAVAFGVALMLTVLLASYGQHHFGGYGRIDGLAGGIIYSYSGHHLPVFFMLSLIGLSSILAYLGFYRRESGVYLGFIFLSLAGAFAVLLSDDFFNLYIFFEVVIISQVAMAVAGGGVSSYKSALKYLLAGNFCGNCMLLAVALLLSIAGSVNIADIQDAVAPLHGGSGLFLLACALSVYAWSYAGGLYPFQNIKSALYASAGPHASALMQAQTKMVLVAVALVLLRIYSAVAGLKELMMGVGALAMVLGVVMALRQDDYQRMLSFHAVSQAGYVAIGLGIGSAVTVAFGIFHAINNMVYKSALFYGCEVMKHKGGGTGFSGLGGFMRGMPFFGLLMLSFKLAISGVPPFNGFQSKLGLMMGALEAGWWEIMVLMLLASVLTFISMMKSFHLIFLRPFEGEVAGGGVPQAVWAVLIALFIMQVVLGLFPEIVLEPLMPLAHHIASLGGGGSV
jgi:energy-converting hydrogenase B subunit F